MKKATDEYIIYLINALKLVFLFMFMLQLIISLNKYGLEKNININSVDEYLLDRSPIITISLFGFFVTQLLHVYSYKIVPRHENVMVDMIIRVFLFVHIPPRQ